MTLETSHPAAVAPHVAAALRVLEESYPLFQANADMAKHWTRVLGSTEPDTLMAAVGRAMERSTKFPPPLPLIRAQLVGEVVRVPVHATDNFGSEIIPPRVVKWVEIRLRPGEEQPASIPQGAECGYQLASADSHLALLGEGGAS